MDETLIRGVQVDSSKRVIPMKMLVELAKDMLAHIEEITDPDERLQHLVDHLAGTIDAHCVLLQRALCIHCGNGVPLVYVQRWGEHLHNGELTCIASGPRKIMGIEPEQQHVIVLQGDKHGRPIS